MSHTVNLLILLVAALIPRSTEFCQALKHEQCVGIGSLCFKRHCTAGRLMPNSAGCRNDLQCRRGITPAWRRKSVACKAGQCFSLASISAQRCQNQAQCPGQSICVREVCVPAAPADYSCRTSGRCGFGQKCIGGLCFRPVAVMGEQTLPAVLNRDLPEYSGSYYDSYEAYDDY
uniref:EB domain-containing protein n=1 Tax=Trichuris muris TaxID=70415 RepID=A0A5S6Q414_TRIMR